MSFVSFNRLIPWVSRIGKLGCVAGLMSAKWYANYTSTRISKLTARVLTYYYRACKKEIPLKWFNNYDSWSGWLNSSSCLLKSIKSTEQALDFFYYIFRFLLTHIFAVSSVDVYYKEDMGLMHSTIAPKVKAIFATEMELLPGDMRFEPEEIMYPKNPSPIYTHPLL